MSEFSELNKKLDNLYAVFQSRMQHFEQDKSVPDPTSTTAQLPPKLSDDYLTFKEFVMSTLSALRLQVDLLAAAQDRQETHLRRKVLLLHGVPEKSDEDLRQSVLNVLTDQMKLSITDHHTLETCHRLGSSKSSDGKHKRPVLVRFSSLHTRQEVWNAKTSLKGSEITVSEFLTPPRHAVYVAGRKHFGMARCWSMDGVVVVLCPDKNRRKVFSMAELEALVEKFPLATVAEALKKDKTAPQAAARPRTRRAAAASRDK